MGYWSITGCYNNAKEDFRVPKIYRHCAQVERNKDTGALNAKRTKFSFFSRSSFRALNELNTLFQQYSELTVKWTFHESDSGDPRENNNSFEIFLNDEKIVHSDCWSHHQAIFGSDLPYIVNCIKQKLGLDIKKTVFNGASEWFCKSPAIPINNAEDAVMAFFVVHQEQFTEDKSRFFARRTYTEDTWGLKEILEHALSDKKLGCFDNRSMSVCKQLGWINNEGNLGDNAPTVVKDMIELIKTAQIQKDTVNVQVIN